MCRKPSTGLEGCNLILSSNGLLLSVLQQLSYCYYWLRETPNTLLTKLNSLWDWSRLAHILTVFIYYCTRDALEFKETRGGDLERSLHLVTLRLTYKLLDGELSQEQLFVYTVVKMEPWVRKVIIEYTYCQDVRWGHCAPLPWFITVWDRTLPLHWAADELPLHPV